LAQSFPPLPPELISFAHGGVSILVGTCNRALVPDCVRGMGVRVSESGFRLSVIIPDVTGRTSLDNVRDNPRLAVTLSQIPTHKTIQVKGAVVGVRPGVEADRALAIRYRELLAEDLAIVGQPAANTLRLGIWPCHVVDLEIEVVYAQTPGPVAGVKMPLAGSAP
jgi:hypothetical protein